MIKAIALKSWKEFIATAQQPKNIKKAFLYRGQSKSDWKLEASLDRYTKKNVGVKNYYRAISKAKPVIETLTQKQWEIPNYPDFAQLVDKAPHDYGWMNIPAYDYMIHLRHHGFPSPLLDWTESPMIALFFAYRQADIDRSEQVAVYSYQPFVEGIGQIGGSEGTINNLGPFIRSHPRHFLQQSQYTMCTGLLDGALCYIPHEDIISPRHIVKYTLPAKDKVKVLKELNLYNLNAHTLFGSEESLMETLAFKELGQ